MLPSKTCVPSRLQFHAFSLSADAPVCAAQTKEVFGAAKGERVSVTCGVEASPGDLGLEFEWVFSKGDEKLDMQQSQIR